METKQVTLSNIKENEANPRQIKGDKFSKLVNSILSFPQMLHIRPIVVDDTGTILGGNMRYRALLSISQMNENELRERIAKAVKGKKIAAKLQERWLSFLDKPSAPVLYASELSDEEKRRFIIEDNVGFGEWDWDRLANEWDSKSLDAWGLDVWQDTGQGQQDGGAEAESNDEKEKGKGDKKLRCPNCGFEFKE